MIYYAAHRRSGRPLISRIDTRGGESRELMRRHDLIEPDGDPEGFKFDWGYVGPAARHLALALISDATGMDDKARYYADRYVRDVLIGLGETWVFSQAVVKGWVAAAEEHDLNNERLLEEFQREVDRLDLG